MEAKQEEIISNALDALNELNTEKQQDEEVILTWLYNEAQNQMKNKLQSQDQEVEQETDIEKLKSFINKQSAIKFNNGICGETCNCIEIAEHENNGTPVKSYPCLGDSIKIEETSEKYGSLKNAIKLSTPPQKEGFEPKIKVSNEPIEIKGNGSNKSTSVHYTKKEDYFPLTFIEWYSGMGKEKIIAAYKRYLSELNDKKSCNPDK